MSAHFIERPRYTCALGGAAAAVSALPEAVAILHSASGCAGNFAWTQNGGSGLQVGGRCGAMTTPSSNVQERDVVFGGDERLREQVASTLQVMDGTLFVVLTGCVTEVIGDDVRAVVHDFRDQGVEIIAVETGGFRGNSYRGYDLVLQALFRDFVERDTLRVSRNVNLWGIAPYGDPFWRGNLEGVRRLLEGLGLKINSFFTPEDTLEGIRLAGSASLNVVTSPIYGIEAAKLFEELHGTPYISLPLPVGATASEAFVRDVGRAAGISTRKINAVIAREKADYFSFLEPLTDCWNDLDLQRYAVVVGDANYAVALTRFLADDLGWLPELTVCTDPLNEQEQELLGHQSEQMESHYSSTLVFETDASRAIEHLHAKWPSKKVGTYHNTFGPGVVVGSSLDRELAQSIGAAHLSVTFPVANRAVLDRGYTGFRGGLRLIEDLVGVVVAGR